MRAWDRLDRAAACYRNTLTLQKDHLPALINLGETLQAAGETDASERCLRSAIAGARPSSANAALAWSNLLIAMQYNPRYSAEELFHAHRQWGERLEARIPAAPAGSRRTAAGKKLRIGYVSADFCNHPAGRFLEPLLRFCDRSGFELFCYATGKIRDDATKRLAGYADGWRDIRECSDPAAAAGIRSDRIDILVDCTGHMADNRLALFARRCAPVQVSWIGYPGTTGLSRIGYRFTDAIADPPGAEAFFTERLVRLPRVFCCYTPPDGAPEVSPLPALAKGTITFGSLHSPARLNGAVIALWSRVLSAVRGSRIIIFRTTLNDDIVERLRLAFIANGIDPGRVDLQHEPPASGYLSLYDHIDIALDTFPWSGHTTACEALWMGVPVITLRGDRHAGRMTSAILSSLAMDDFIAETPDAFAALATRTAADLPALAAVRQGLRERVRSSPLCDGKSFTEAVETAYRTCFSMGCQE